MDKNIIKFIKKMHLVSVAVISEDIPYAFSCFYAFDEDRLNLLVASSSTTTHIKALAQNPEVGGTIALDTKIVGKIEGIQLRGTMQKANEQMSKIYFKRYPYALAMKPEIWCISLKWIKFTSNTLGFGKKLIWER
ncbi:hypothetical protein KDD93_02905 [Campylobacter sp. faydin G-24]|uniref:Pyridoxamine 5'-phosphate oxidase putative domain-containing protein n=1 Tax=Campylobacter anatolicus TaxID=2829105 RepID=A0ABS5HGW2_9BACT|nr:hypothetical protein [Campylobacter anatolicus]MBR8465126.1 hypothetical protein [Campylobacter anatolicus]